MFLETRSTNQLRDDFFFHMHLSRLGLSDMWEWIEKNNPAADLPYHNNRHMFRMAQTAHKLLVTSSYYSQMKPLDRLMAEVRLIGACLWHDYGHSGGTKPDADNIQFATDAMRNWVMDNPRSGFYRRLYGGFTEEPLMNNLEILSKAIACTEFPFIHEPETFVEQCIRDADLLWVMSDDAVDINLGLMQEMKPKLPEGTTVREFFKRNIDFHHHAVYYTDTGKALNQLLATKFAADLMMSPHAQE
jgi:hypothetical protein